MKTIYHPGYRRMIARLHDARIKRGLTQAQVARQLKTATSWVSKIEHCDLRLDVLHLVLLCRAYGIAAHKIVKEMEEEPSSGSSAPFLLSYRRPTDILGPIAHDANATRLRSVGHIPILPELD